MTADSPARSTPRTRASNFSQGDPSDGCQTGHLCSAMPADSPARSTPRTFVRVTPCGVRWILRPVYAAPRPGAAYVPVTLSEVWARRVIR